jgi:aldehyde:ferredoxin oxidoreductase
MIFREGIGDVLAEGLLTAAKKIGRNSEYYINHVRGLAMHELGYPNVTPAFKGVVLSIALNARGDSVTAMSPMGAGQMPIEELRTITGMPDIPEGPDGFIGFSLTCDGKPEIYKYLEDVAIIADSLSMCKQHSRWAHKINPPEDIAEFLSVLSGRAVDVQTLFDYADKIRTLEYAYLLQEGYTREKQVLPERFYEPIKEGPFTGMQLTHEELEGMKTKYYQLRGWDEKTGIPTEETLKRYGFNKAAQNLKDVSG